MRRFFRIVKQNPPMQWSRKCGDSRFRIIETLSSTNFEIGSFAELSHTFEQSDVETFANICGDNNPLHINEEFASKSRFGGTIVHGILLSSLFSTLLGRTIPGSIYVSQTLSFKRPVRVGGNQMYI